MKVLLFSLTGFGNKVLDALIEASCHVIYLFSRQERGAFPYYQEKDLRQYAGEKNIPVSDEFDWSYVRNVIERHEPDLLLVATFHKTIPGSIIRSVPLCVNLHPSLLPEYGGPTPIDWVLHFGEKDTGVTGHFITEELDGGDILIQKKISIDSDDTKSSLMGKLATLAASVTKDLIKNIETNSLKPVPQDQDRKSYFPRFAEKNKSPVLNAKIAIVILGGCLTRNAAGGWRTTNFDEGDNYGLVGDRLRVVAASHLFNDKKNNMIIALGGKGQFKDIPDIPPIGEVVKGELVSLGVPERKVLIETESGNTYEQLKSLCRIIKKERIDKVVIISNRYHLPRINAMIQNLSDLNELKCYDILETVSAEDILIKNNPEKWESPIQAAYRSPEMKRKISLEREGIEMIKNGTYRFE